MADLERWFQSTQYQLVPASFFIFFSFLSSDKKLNLFFQKWQKEENKLLFFLENKLINVWNWDKILSLKFELYPNKPQNNQNTLNYVDLSRTKLTKRILSDCFNHLINVWNWYKFLSLKFELYPNKPQNNQSTLNYVDLSRNTKAKRILSECFNHFKKKKFISWLHIKFYLYYLTLDNYENKKINWIV